MDSMDMKRVKWRARVGYETSRLLRALVGFSPVLIVVAVAAVFATRPSLTVALGLALFAAGVVFLSYGRNLKRAVLPGVVAGLVPLVLALCALHVQHACASNRCMMICIPACAIGGIVAGLTIGSLGIRHGRGAAFWVPASALALLTGAMGCACVGYAGVIGLALGFGAGLVPRLARDFLTGRAA